MTGIVAVAVGIVVAFAVALRRIERHALADSDCDCGAAGCNGEPECQVMLSARDDLTDEPGMLP